MEPKLFTKNFTLLVLGQVSSLFGNFILKFALSMYVLEVTGSAAIFAGILAAATIPTILLSPFGGILADRANRRNIMAALDTLTGLSVLCAALLFSEKNGIAVISVLLLLLSVLGAFESPTVQASVPQMQTGQNLIKGNAIVNQVAACIFSIFSLSYIQQKTPTHLTGKVMAYISTISMCAQPLGQTLYGLLFDGFRDAVYLVLIPTGVIVGIIGLLRDTVYVYLFPTQIPLHLQNPYYTVPQSTA